MRSAIDIEVLPNPVVVAERAAQSIVFYSRESIGERGLFSIALSGGSTPKTLYQLLADPNREFREQLAWERMHFFWTDERHVGPDHPDSNYRMVNDALLAHVPVPGSNVHRILSEKVNASEAADDYESHLKGFFNLDEKEPPRIDLVLLGMGADGHTASIFTDSDALQERHRLVVAPWVQKLNSYRITMTLPTLNNAAEVLFLVTGEDKANTLAEVLQAPPSKLPAQEIQPTRGQLTWLIDSAAASKL